jgi:hypothetical protein
MEDRLNHPVNIVAGGVPEGHRHVDAEMAERYLMGDSPEPELSAVEEHLLVCAACREQIDDTSVYLCSMSDAARELRTHPRGLDRQLWRVWGSILIGAAILLCHIIARR